MLFLLRIALRRRVLAQGRTRLDEVESKALVAAFGIAVLTEDGKMHAVIDRANTELKLVGSKDRALNVDGINRERKDGEIIIFTKEFGNSTLTSQNGIEIIVDEQSGRVLQTRRGGSSQINDRTFVISFTTDKSETVSSFLKSQNNIVRVVSAIKPVNEEKFFEFKNAVDIVGGVGYILQKGNTVIDWTSEKTSKGFYESRHPRTAFAVLNDGKFLLVTIDGRQPEHSVGVGLEELAAILRNLGAVEVINLDGGGSTAMVLEGKIVNKPSDKEGERRVSDALLVFPKK
jgi:predicted house-cleaning NTP pyrophosphatase (Maf/HAM1 superfamily)